jgi:hypothetical protein
MSVHKLFKLFLKRATYKGFESGEFGGRSVDETEP